MEQGERDHGGNLERAIAAHGGAPEDWIDLSTGINPVPYPVPPIPAEAWTRLPPRPAMRRLTGAAAAAYGTGATVIPFAGAQAAIQAVPFLVPPSEARILAPTYNEHAGALADSGWRVAEVPDLAALEGSALAVLVNPNNPDGRRHAPEALLALAGRVGTLVVDESFADPEPALSLAPALAGGPGNIVVLRSFGKFYGLAGLRLGFALATGNRARRLAELAGPWPVSGPAIEIAALALADTAWEKATAARLASDASRLDGLAERAGWTLTGGTPLFRTYATPDAASARERLARHRIWSRIFPYAPRWIRLGLPGTEEGWARLATALGETG